VPFSGKVGCAKAGMLNKKQYTKAANKICFLIAISFKKETEFKGIRSKLTYKMTNGLSLDVKAELSLHRNFVYL
jgi:hypothetical protein